MFCRFGLVDGTVNLLYDPDKHASIDPLHKGIPYIHRLVHVHGTGDAFPACDDCFGSQGIYEILSRNLQQSLTLYSLINIKLPYFS